MNFWVFWSQIDAIFLSLILGIFCLFAYLWRKEKFFLIWSISWFLVVARIYLGIYYPFENEYRFFHDLLYIASDLGWIWGLTEILSKKKKILNILIGSLFVYSAGSFYLYFIKSSIVSGTIWSLAVFHPAMLTAISAMFWMWGRKIKAFAPKLISISYLLWAADFIIFGISYYAYESPTAGAWGWTIGLIFRTAVFVGFLILILRPYYAAGEGDKVFHLGIRDKITIFSVASLILLGLTTLVFLQITLPKFIAQKKSIFEILRNISVLISFIIVVYSLIAMKLSRTFLNPIYRLFNGIKKVKRGELEKIAKIKTYDEIDGLSGEFNELFSKLGELYLQLEESYLSIIATLINAVESKDSFLAGHSVEVGKLSRKIAKALGLPPADCKQIEWAGYLHDIGKIGIPLSILNKPITLTDEEIKIIRKHTAKGAEILKMLPFIDRIIPYIRYHHEKPDGSGYNGLRESEIPLGAKIIAAADAFCAMSSNRPYRKAKRETEIIEEIKRFSGKQFDPGIVEILIKITESRKK